MVLIIIEEDGSQSIVNCLTNYRYPKKCKKYHRGMLGCNPKCPHFKEKEE